VKDIKDQIFDTLKYTRSTILSKKPTDVLKQRTTIKGMLWKYSQGAQSI
jgi:uncharacterized protein (DUF1919 family)